MLSITDEYDSFINCTDNKKDDIIINVKFLLLSVPGSVLLLSLIGLIIYTTLEPLKTSKKGEKILDPTDPVRCIITRPSQCGISYFQTNLF